MENLTTWFSLASLYSVQKGAAKSGLLKLKKEKREKSPPQMNIKPRSAGIQSVTFLTQIFPIMHNGIIKIKLITDNYLFHIRIHKVLQSTDLFL